jgi:hypothetical protein
MRDRKAHGKTHGGIPAGFRSAWRTALARIATVLLAAFAIGCSSDDDRAGPPAAAAPANILFVVMDDVGIDQMAVFGFGGPDSPATPSIDTMARSGVRFDDAWSMPACSTSRATFFTGHFPLRTQVKGALGPDDLANAMVSPFATTVPKLLAGRGYESALFGKLHIALPGNNPAGDGIARDLGFDHFAGWLDETGDPSSIDTTAGGAAPAGTYGCGFVPGRAVDPDNGADSGSCYQPDGTCTELASALVPPGRTCRDRGGLLDRNQRCAATAPAYLDFSRMSGHFVSPVVYNRADGSIERLPTTDPRARTFRPVFAVDEAIGWIGSRPAGNPWMATVSFAAAHMPLMQPPVDPAVPSTVTSSGLDCTNVLAQRELANQVIESMDREIGRLLVGAGVARRTDDGTLVPTADAANTMVVIVGDNGSLGTTVKPPFDSSRAKGTAYQTGVWVPLVVAGPLVAGRAPGGRVVSSMVNLTDLYALFAEIAGITDVQAAVAQPLDAQPMLAYLADPAQGPVRTWNYTEVGLNLQANGALNGPCIIGASCSQIPVTAGVCADNNGTWWGPGTVAEAGGVKAPEGGFKYCSQVNAFLAANGEATFAMQPLTSVAVRDGRYKLVENGFVDCDPASPQQCVERIDNEFYEITTTRPVVLDTAGAALAPDTLSPEQRAAFDALAARLAAIRASATACPGDGNGDLVVDARDLAGWESFARPWGRSSVYDLNLDGLTDDVDRSLVTSNLGRDCRTPAAAAAMGTLPLR